MGDSTDALAAYSAYGEHIREYRLPLSPRIEEVIARVREEQQTRRLAEIREPPALPAVLPLDERLVVGGALPPGSPFYVERAEDAEVFDALLAPGATVRVKGPRQVGKSSLLARALCRCRGAGALVLLTDWQNLTHDALASAEGFYAALAHKLADQAGIDADPASVFRAGRAPGDNFDRFVQRLLVPAAADRPIVWAIDEADRIFGCDFRDEVFGKLRAWHNDRALDPDSPWARFSLVLTYATEAHLFIKNLNQSPFNVGTAVALKDFTLPQSAELNERCGEPLARREEVERLYRLVGGHPFLTSRALYEAKRHGRTIDQLEETADEPDGPFHDHLERLRFTLGMSPELAEAVRACMHEGAAPAMEPFLRLCAAGMMTGPAPARMQPRCAVYERYLRRALT
jgi:hypothetical protein